MRRTFFMFLMSLGVLHLQARNPLSAQSVSPEPPAMRTPRIGLLLPVHPADYSLIMDALANKHEDHVGPFVFITGEIEHVPVVLNVAPADGVVMRSLAAQSMFEHYNVRAVVYPGTSGAALDPDRMHVGDVVIGAENMEVGNFYMGPDGNIASGVFDTATQKRPFHDFYADPKLLGMMACAATHEVAAKPRPAWLNPQYPKAKTTIFYYGVQGTTTMWVEQRELFDKIRGTFHHFDEDGDWDSNLAAVLYKVTFIEVSVIANSTLEFPGVYRGRPKAPSGEDDSPLYAQRLSYRITLTLLQRFGTQMLSGSFTNPQSSPFPSSYFADPTNPQGLMQGMDCR